MAIAIMKFRCGHTHKERFDYDRAARDWERFAKHELCDDCATKALSISSAVLNSVRGRMV